MRAARLGVLALAALAGAVVGGCDGALSGPRLDVVAGADQRGLPGEALRSVVRVRLSDGGAPAAGVAVRTEVEGGGSVQASGTRTDGAGEIAFAWRLGGEGPQRLRVVADGAEPVEVDARAIGPDEADAVVITGGTPRALAVVSYASAEPEIVYERRLGAGETTALLPPLDASEHEVIVFGVGEAPGVQAVTWTPAPDRVEVALRPPVPIDIVVFITEPPFEETRARALQDVEWTTDLWAREGVGVVFGDVEIVDRTGPGGGITLSPGSGCGTGVVDPDRINVHYVAEIVTFAGYSCGAREIYMDVEGPPFQPLLAHEIGHSLSLRHSASGLMATGARSGSRVFDGQIFRTHLSTFSALNEVYGAYPEAARSCFRGPCLPANYEAP